MKLRRLGNTNQNVSTIGLGTWQLGAGWGDVESKDAYAVLEAAAESGVTFFDTADVYGDGRSEEFIGSFLSQNPGHDIFVATKMGRREDQVAANYSLENFRKWTDRSRTNLKTEVLDLVQLHCPPTDVIESEAVYDALDTLVEEGRIKNYGVSVEESGQALEAMRRPRLASVQIVLNAFRLKPIDAVLSAAKKADVGIIARVPLASGLLSGKYSAETAFAENDHRSFNRNGNAFDVGETFSGVNFEKGLQAVAEFEELVPAGITTAQAAIGWVVAQEGVSSVIPGARNADQARSNASAADIPALNRDFMAGVREIYDRNFREDLHLRW